MAVTAVAAFVANCGSAQKVSGSSVDPKYGVSPSPRVVAEGETVPKGGGRELVGRPYVVAGRTYVPQDSRGYVREGLASWYGTAFHGRMTANGEVFDRYSVAAAHPTMPLPSYARVTNLKNRRSMIVRVNDRGPYHADRIMDVSEMVADALDFRRAGTANVRVEYVGKASLQGSDDQKLLATLREDGRPAPIPGMTSPVMVAERAGVPQLPRQQALAYRTADLDAKKPEMMDSPAFDPAPSPRTPSPVLAVTATPIQIATPQSYSISAVPRPPERPLDLETIPGAATPVRGKSVPVAQLPPPRTAGLFFVDPDLPRSRFTKDDPFRDMKPQRFVALKGQP